MTCPMPKTHAPNPTAVPIKETSRVLIQSVKRKALLRSVIVVTWQTLAGGPHLHISQVLIPRLNGVSRKGHEKHRRQVRRSFVAESSASGGLPCLRMTSWVGREMSGTADSLSLRSSECGQVIRPRPLGWAWQGRATRRAKTPSSHLKSPPLKGELA